MYEIPVNTPTLRRIFEIILNLGRIFLTQQVSYLLKKIVGILYFSMKKIVWILELH